MREKEREGEKVSAQTSGLEKILDFIYGCVLVSYDIIIAFES